MNAGVAMLDMGDFRDELNFGMLARWAYQGVHCRHPTDIYSVWWGATLFARRKLERSKPLSLS